MTSPLQEKLKTDNGVVGIWSIVSSAVSAEIGALAGLDFQIFDLEHGNYNLEELGNSIRACEGAGGNALVRVPDLNPSIFQSVLDLGVQGLIVPRIKSALDAERAVEYAKYPPLGSRGYNPFVRAAAYASPPDNQGGNLRNDYAIVAVIIENLEAYADLSAILRISEIDIIYLGVYDMSLALGCNGDIYHARVREFVEDAAARVRGSGKALGMMVRGQEEIKAAMRLGARFLVHGVDSEILRSALVNIVGSFTSARKVLGE